MKLSASELEDISIFGICPKGKASVTRGTLDEIKGNAQLFQ